MERKIYTKKGDQGDTSLFGGKRILKNHPRVSAYGSIDELNSLLGVVLAKLNDKRVEAFINQIQKDLFLISSYLAGAKISFNNLAKRVKEMEQVIDFLSQKLPLLSNFILPEGKEAAVFLYFTRAVARRAERELVTLSRKEAVNKEVLKYFNRLSDLLFIIARYINHKAGVIETVWKRH